MKNLQKGAMVERVVKMKKDHWQNVHYSRRNNPEFVEIPAIISQENLDDNVLQSLRSIDVEVQPEDIKACHRPDYGKNESKNNPKRDNRKKSKLGNNKETSIFINHCWRISIRLILKLSCTYCHNNYFLSLHAY